MHKQTIQYDSPIDALVAVAKRLSAYEQRFSMRSEDFYDRYSKGDHEDSIDLESYPNHKHSPSGVTATQKPSIVEAILTIS